MRIVQRIVAVILAATFGCSTGALAGPVSAVHDHDDHPVTGSEHTHESFHDGDLPIEHSHHHHHADGTHHTHMHTHLAGGGVVVAAAGQPRAALPQDGPVYVISHFELRYRRDHPDHPDLSLLHAMPIGLGLVEDGYVAPRQGVDIEWTTLGQLTIPSADTSYYASAVQWIIESILGWYIENDFMAVRVDPDFDDISPRGEDIRAPGRTALGLVISTGIVSELRTLGSGERVSDKGPILPEDRINNAVHERHRLESPIQPYDPNSDLPRSDLLRRDSLNDFIYFRSRHPGRRMDVSLSPGSEPDTAALDYLITENRPLTIFGQLSNTGTPSTDYLRQRFGFFHTQFTENDDILSLDYTTANFDDVHALLGSYDAPLSEDRRLRYRVYGSWAEYDASEVGFFNDTFSGESWGVGGELVGNVYQDDNFFLDLLGGVRYSDIEVENPFVGTGEESFLIPYVGARLEQVSEWYDTRASVIFEFQYTDPDEVELAQLGRTSPDSEWTVMRWNASHSVYLEPLLNRANWEDPSTPESSTLAHEIRASFRGQYAFDNRLIPQEEAVAGGLYSVRGYPQSVVAGDTALIGSLEYRYHVPRGFGIEPEPTQFFGQPFRRAPQYVFGMPDWDLVFKGFIDIGRVYQSDRLSFESHETLIGAGVGFDLLLRRNVNLRVDWGFVLKEIETADVNEGSDRLHFVLTILY
ncbi:MAG: ShlB/FhaC/HecB family hemolysin secretion/activation protein [Planctomycetota bacterium]